MARKHNSTPKKKRTYFSKYDLYSDANPKDTVRIKYDTIDNTKKTIKKLERLRKSGKYTHARIVRIANVMNQRLRVIYDNTGKGKTRYNLSKKYFEKLKKETQSRRRRSRKRGSKSYSPRRAGKKKSRRRRSWSQKYKKSINCNKPKGFSQRAYCAGKKKHRK